MLRAGASMNDPSTGVDGRALVLHVNGQEFGLAPGSTVADLLTVRELTGKRVAVELNGAIVPRSRHVSTIFAAGDRVEIVVAVGGG